jgi:hypothetical protein
MTRPIHPTIDAIINSAKRPKQSAFDKRCKEVRGCVEPLVGLVGTIHFAQIVCDVLEIDQYDRHEFIQAVASKINQEI